jgi:HNH endonuclease
MKLAQWLLVRELVLRRDKYQCQTCFKRAQDVHHIIPRRKQGLDILENLTSVCVACHKLIELFKTKSECTIQPKAKIETLKVDNVDITNLRFRAKVTAMGDKYHIYIPQAYRKEAEALEKQLVEIEVIEA